MVGVFLKIVIVAYIMILSEFCVRIMVYNRLFSIYPYQKYKTISKKIKSIGTMATTRPKDAMSISKRRFK